MSSWLVLLFASTVCSVVYNISAGSFWNARLSSLQPGDVLTLLPQTPGTPYTYTVTFRNAFVLNGNPSNPITVQGAPGETITIAMNANQNVCEITGRYFIFQNLRLTATASAPGAIGLRLTGNTSHAIIRGVTIFDVPENAFTANAYGSRYENVTFTECEAYNTGGTGECFYVGCQSTGSQVACEFVNGALTNNYCHDTCKPAACTGGSMGSGYQVKGWGSFGNSVKNNVCARVAQVCILLYDDFDLGPNTVEGNWIFGSVADAGIQVSAGAIIRNNVIYSNKKGIVVTTNSVNLYPSKSNRNIVISGNTLVNNGGTGLSIPTLNPTLGSRIANNAVIEDAGNAFSGGSQTGVIWLNNAYYGGTAPSGVSATGAKLVGTSSTEFQNVAAYNFHPKAGSALLAAGATLTANDVLYDFACVTRGAIPTVGAYETTSGSALTFAFQAGCAPGGGSKTFAPTPSPNSNTGCAFQSTLLLASLSLLSLLW